MEATWQPHEKHDRLTTKSDLPDSVFAFPKQRKEPLTDAKHVRNAVTRFDQVTDVSDDDRALAFANIEKAAKFYDVDLSETSWQQLGVHPQPHREESARKGAETRTRTGEAREAAIKGAATRKRLGIAEEAAKKAAATRRRKHNNQADGLAPAIVSLARGSDRYAEAIEESGGTPSGNEQQDEQTAISVLKEKTPLGVPWVEPEDVAPLVVFLASDAARMVSGTSFAATGGDSGHVTA